MADKTCPVCKSKVDLSLYERYDICLRDNSHNSPVPEHGHLMVRVCTTCKTMIAEKE